MKNKIIYLLLILLLFPMFIFAEETYETIDLNININEEIKISELELEIYVSTAEDDTLEDKTEEFEYESLNIYKLDENETLLDKDYVLKSDENYKLEINNIKSKKGNKINAFGVDNILINGENVNQKYFDYTNDSKTLSISYQIYREKKEETPVVENNTKEENETEKEYVEVLPIKKDDTCFLGLAICCKKFHNLSYCGWGIILLVLIILIKTLISLISSRMEDKKYKDF